MSRKKKKKTRLPMVLLAALCAGAITMGASWMDGPNVADRVFKLFEKKSGPSTDGWELTLANESHPLPDDFAIETATVNNGKSFDARASDALENMLSDARKDGLSPLVCSAYRSVSTQKRLYKNKIQEYVDKGYSRQRAEEIAKTIVAVPGTSEHNLGLAADIVCTQYQKLDRGYADTEMAKWLKENSWKYGFILRYPDGKSDITGIIFEPWHYRYVGVDAAKEIMDQGITLEEYLDVKN